MSGSAPRDGSRRALAPRSPKAPARVTQGRVAKVPSRAQRLSSRALGLTLALWVGSCSAPVVVRERVPPPPAPFERYPYLLEVRPDGARIAWTSSAREPGRVTYRVVDASPERAGEQAAGPGGYVNLTGLGSGVTVEYAVYLEGAALTPGLRFRTAPRKGARTRFRFLVWGDSGSGKEPQIEVARQIASRHRSRPFDFALHTGDLAYPHGSPSYLTERHFRIYRAWLHSVPVYPAAGNHDLKKDGGQAFAEAFLEPRGLGHHRRYYSFDYANAHFVALDSNEGDDVAGSGGDLRDRGSAQRAWLERDLAAAVTDTLTDWIIVYLHHPPYSAAAGLSGHGSDPGLRESLTPLFDRFGVDVVFAGHDHNYERSHPLRGDAVAERGTVYVVTGGGGASRRFRTVSHGWWTAQYGRLYHFLDVEIAGDTLRAEAVDHRGQVADRFVLTLP